VTPGVVAPALQIWSHVYCRHFDSLPPAVQRDITGKVDELGTRLDTWPHNRLRGCTEFRLRVGNYRVLYDFDLTTGRLYLLYVGHRREVYR
jgi:mRNA-degrading endonuclease RelE of RelBE toxin-antitoxin system